MRCIRLALLLVSTLFAALLLAPPAWALTPVTFTGPTNFAVGDGPNSVAVGDFNGDGDPDLAVANEFAGSVSVLLGGAGGSFGAATNIATGGFPFAVAVGDFNGDSDPDLAVADAFDGIISVLLGSTGGTFTGPTNFPAGSFPAAVAVGDFNGDGDPDLAVADQVTGEILVLRGIAGGGGFTAPATVGTATGPFSIAVGNFNGDSDPDLAVADQFSGNVLVLLGSTGANFTAPATVASGADPDSVAVGDFNSDGDPDLAVADQSPGEIMVLLGSTGGTFTGPTILTTDSGVSSVAVADFNRDGDPDLAVSNVNLSRVSVLLGSTGSTFTAQTNFAVGSTQTSVAAADFDGDSKPDLAATKFNTDNVGVLLNSTVTNRAPVAAADTYSTAEDTTLTVTAPGVLGNDSDPDGNPLSAVPAPSHGTLTLNANGSFTYTPALNFAGTDSFTYRASDGTLTSGLTTVTITVNAVNDAPTAAIEGVTDGAIYEIGEVPTAICEVTDVEDGNSSFSAALSGNLSHGLGTQTAACQHTDKGGLAADPVSVTYTIVDTGDPTIDHTLDLASPNDNDWYKTNVAVDFSCHDSESGIKSCEGDTTLHEGKNQSVTGTATDWADNTTTDTVSGINIDKTPPTVGFNGGPTGNYYFGNDPAAPTCDATDGLSGFDSCEITGGGTSVGQRSYKATAKDKAGNIATATLNYEVLPWTVKGFYQPVDMNGVWNTVKGGSSVPLKFEIFSASTELTNTSSIKSFTQKNVACPGASAATDEIEIVTTGGTNLRYDSTAGQFIQNWQTPKKPGTCYVTTMTSQDGSTVSANFMLK
jgi:VCBS repeat-containing protein